MKKGFIKIALLAVGTAAAAFPDCNNLGTLVGTFDTQYSDYSGVYECDHSVEIQYYSNDASVLLDWFVCFSEDADNFSTFTGYSIICS